MHGRVKFAAVCGQNILQTEGKVADDQHHWRTTNDGAGWRLILSQAEGRIGGRTAELERGV